MMKLSSFKDGSWLGHKKYCLLWKDLLYDVKREIKLFILNFDKQSPTKTKKKKNYENIIRKLT